MLDRGDASDIINEVTGVISDWQRVATENQIPIRVLEQYDDKWTHHTS
jgi:hypothetical protein